MELIGVRVEIPANTPMVLLQEQDGAHRLMPIYIGNPEASAIHYALEGTEPPRPLTHDLFVATVQRLGATLDQVVITEVRDHIYYAELHITLTKQAIVMSSRPSDAIALAVRTGAPIFAADELIDLVGQLPQASEEGEAEEIIDEFKDFIDNVSPDDFAT